MEHGEFYYRAGVCYYKIDRFDRAMPYLDKARRFFALDPMYVEKELQAEMIPATSYRKRANTRRRKRIF
ncbi:hypothetical protein CHH78_13905 [Shouchella clausii]|uniref:hypothetical protein n=1 Tax=Shouchella clausii TaxID=79880 RepID=UPI000BA5D76C|nr:hypothetical protein [Shouchella clausii]MBU8596362.1 hypothetical protein [Shouchella clausii]MCY1104021.1 hypothetical protein [Shouchella clausii]PAD09297.1 hypothetical protein CHH76_10160 [Shouchella clausii]PAD94217.1 hypothetical protein CHH52_00295 [Shouchella clausii]PAE80945.1 hypothetical protein CHH78_13905 [Shouchella clausii]